MEALRRFSHVCAVKEWPTVRATVEGAPDAWMEACPPVLHSSGVRLDVAIPAWLADQPDSDASRLWLKTWAASAARGLGVYRSNLRRRVLDSMRIPA
jgi:hypothetical protein